MQFVLQQRLELGRTHEVPVTHSCGLPPLALDSIDRAFLCATLMAFRDPDKHVRLLKALYTDNTNSVQGDGSRSLPFNTKAGVCQGCLPYFSYSVPAYPMPCVRGDSEAT
eukprot:360166-Chlamydomonas_euryale.AAC.3